MKKEDSEAPKIGYALNSYQHLPDNAFHHLVQIGMRPKRAPPEKGTSKEKGNDEEEYPACGSKGSDPFHAENCKACNGRHKATHDLMVSFLIQKLGRTR